MNKIAALAGLLMGSAVAVMIGDPVQASTYLAGALVVFGLSGRERDY